MEPIAVTVRVEVATPQAARAVVSVLGARRGRGHVEAAVPAAEAVRTGTSGTAALIARQRDLRDVTLQKRKTGVARVAGSAGGARRGVFRDDTHQSHHLPPVAGRGAGGGRRRVDGRGEGRKATGRDAGLSSPAMVAEVVATPVLERLRAAAGAGVVRGATERAAYLDLGGFVVALTAPGVPLMPNGIAVPRTDVADGAVRAGPDGIVLSGGAVVSWDGAARWDPALRRAAPEDAPVLRARAAAVLDALGVAGAEAGAADAAPVFAAFGLSVAEARAAPAPTAAAPAAGGERARAGLEHLRRAVADRDAGAAARAADRLLGLGGGLTPEGDDVLAATAAVVAAAGDAAGFAAPDRARWLAALGL